MEELDDNRTNTIIDYYNEAKYIAKEKFGTDDPAVITACMSAFFQYDILDVVNELDRTIQQIRDEHRADMSNFLYSLEKTK